MEANQPRSDGVIEIRCERCHKLLGTIQPATDLMETDDLIIRVLFAWCKRCKEPIYYTLSERLFEKFLRKQLARDVVK